MNTEAVTQRPPFASASSGVAGAAEVPYHRVLAGTRPRVWRGIVALVLLVVGYFVCSFVLGMLGVLLDNLSGRTGPLFMSPYIMGSAYASLALLTPLSMLLQRWLFKVPAASLHSVFSRFRFDLMGRTLVVIAPIWIVYLVVTSPFMAVAEAAWVPADLLGMMLVTIIFTPLQAMGEEYGFRGLVMRIAACWGRGDRSGLVIGVLVSSVVFMFAHVAADPWLNLYYFSFGAGMALIAWRSGGLEIPVVVHAVNNTLAFLISLALRSDPEAGFDRSAGVASAVMLVPCAMVFGVAAVVWFRTRRTGPLRGPAPVGPARQRVDRPTPANEVAANPTMMNPMTANPMTPRAPTAPRAPVHPVAPTNETMQHRAGSEWPPTGRGE